MSDVVSLLLCSGPIPRTPPPPAPVSVGTAGISASNRKAPAENRVLIPPPAGGRGFYFTIKLLLFRGTFMFDHMMRTEPPDVVESCALLFSKAGATARASPVLSPLRVSPAGSRLVRNSRLSGPGSGEGPPCCLRVRGQQYSAVSPASAGLWDVVCSSSEPAVPFTFGSPSFTASHNAGGCLPP